MEKPSIGELLKVLKGCKKSNEQIIEIFQCIIQRKVMYGGNIQDSIDFELDKAKRGSLLNN